MATIKDIANLAGVSVATVSYVLNNRNVSADKKERVLKAIKELNYVPNAVARGLRVRESKTICFIVSDITNPFYPELAKACEEEVYSRGYMMTMINTNNEADRLDQALYQMKQGRIDGCIIADAMQENRTAIEEAIKDGYPIVLVNRHLENLDVDAVICDNLHGADLAAKHLIALGHTKIAFVGGFTGSSVHETRKLGFIKAMEAAGLSVLPEWIISGGGNYSQSYKATEALLRLPADQRPTAVINLADFGALGVIDAATDLNLQVPGDLAVIGFDDLFFAATRTVQLTTVRTPRYELGSRAISMLFERIENKPSLRQVVSLPVELIVRRTCGFRA